jgi:hypothetical protein
MVRDHLNLIVLVGVGAAIVPIALHTAWRVVRRVIRLAVQ